MSESIRSQRNARKGDINLFPTEIALGWRVIRTTTVAEGAEKLARGEWREVYDESGNFWGYQVLANFKKDEDLVSGAISGPIIVNQCLLNAGLFRPSHTATKLGEKRSRKNECGYPRSQEVAMESAQPMWPSLDAANNLPHSGHVLESPERILRLQAVIARCGLSRSSIYLRIASGDFPAPISLGARAVGFLESEVAGWISGRIHASRHPARKSNAGSGMRDSREGL